MSLAATSRRSGDGPGVDSPAGRTMKGDLWKSGIMEHVSWWQHPEMGSGTLSNERARVRKVGRRRLIPTSRPHRPLLKSAPNPAETLCGVKGMRSSGERQGAATFVCLPTVGFPGSILAAWFVMSHGTSPNPTTRSIRPSGPIHPLPGFPLQDPLVSTNSPSAERRVGSCRFTAGPTPWIPLARQRPS